MVSASVFWFDGAEQYGIREGHVLQLDYEFKNI